MSSRKMSLSLSSFMITLIVNSAHTALASDKNIPQPDQAQKSRVFHSGATSANSDPSRFTRPLTKDEVMAGNVPHMMPPLAQKANKPIPKAPAGRVIPHDNPSHKPHAVDCPTGSQKGWIITEGDHRYMILEDGTKVNLDHAGHETPAVHTPPTHHGKPEAQDDSEEARNLRRNPLLTAEEEKLREDIEKHGLGSMYDRNNEKEFGKEYQGKVYFKATPGTPGYKPGLWEADPSIKPQGLTEKKRPSAPFKMVKPAPSTVPAKKPEHVKPGAVGLTARTNTAHTNPQTGKVELEQGHANVAQTGLTKGPAPKIDTSETKSAVPPPPSSTTTTTTTTTNKPAADAPKPADTAAPAA